MVIKLIRKIEEAFFEAHLENISPHGLSSRKKTCHCDITFTRLSTTDHFFVIVCLLDDCLIALKFAKNLSILKLFSFFRSDFSLRSYVLRV